MQLVDDVAPYSFRRRGGERMPWGSFSNWTEEERHAVLVYLRHLPPIRHATPEPAPGNAIPVPGAIEVDYAARDYGEPAK